MYFYSLCIQHQVSPVLRQEKLIFFNFEIPELLIFVTFLSSHFHCCHVKKLVRMLVARKKYI